MLIKQKSLKITGGINDDDSENIKNRLKKIYTDLPYPDLYHPLINPITNNMYYLKLNYWINHNVNGEFTKIINKMEKLIGFVYHIFLPRLHYMKTTSSKQWNFVSKFFSLYDDTNNFSNYNYNRRQYSLTYTNDFANQDNIIDRIPNLFYANPDIDGYLNNAYLSNTNAIANMILASETYFILMYNINKEHMKLYKNETIFKTMDTTLWMENHNTIAVKYPRPYQFEQTISYTKLNESDNKYYFELLMYHDRHL